MGIIQSVASVLWARRRQPQDVAYGVALGHERFGPRELLDQAVEAERAGFDFVSCSDHLTPWWDPADRTPAHCANAWVWHPVKAPQVSVSDRKFAMMAIVSADPARHVRQLKMIKGMGATAVAVMNVSAADPLGMLRMYSEKVLPELRG